MASSARPSRRSRSAPATSRRRSGASRRSRSSSRSGRSCPGRSRRWARSPRSRTRTRATGRTGSSCSAKGLPADAVVERLTAADVSREQRQLGVVDAAGRGAPRSPGGCTAGRADASAPATPRRATSSSRAPRSTRSPTSFVASAGTPLAERLSTASPPRRRPAATGAGSSRPRSRGRARRRLRRLSDALSTFVSTTTPSGSRELRRLYGLHELLFGKTPRAVVGVDDATRGSSRAARAPRLRDAGRLGGGGEPGGARRRRGHDRPGRARGAAEDGGMRSVHGDRWTGSRVRGRGPSALAHAPLGARYRVVRINAWRATAPGQELIGQHDELGQGAGGHEELYIVVSGHATFTVDGETLEAPARTVVFVKDPSVRRSAMARDEGTTVLVVGGKPGDAFAVSAWERSAEALRYWSTEDWDTAIEVLEASTASIRRTPASSTTSPAPSHARVAVRARSRTWPRRSRSSLASVRTPQPTRTSTRSATTCGSRTRDAHARQVRVSPEAPALDDQRPQQGPPGCPSPDQRACPRLGGGNARAPAHDNGSPVGQAAHDAAHVLPGRHRPRRDRIERRLGQAARLVAQPATEPTRSRRGRHRRAHRHSENGVEARARAALGRDHSHVRRLRRYQERTTRPIPVVLLTPDRLPGTRRDRAAE